jgi:RNA polymerase sigma-70 factor (ECF subfamily)
MKSSCELVAPVFQEYRDILTRFITSRVNDPVDQEELLSQVMMKIYDNCEKVDDIRNTEAWLITIAKNTITDYFRERQKRHSESLPLELSEIIDEDLIQHLSDCIPSLIKKLPKKYAQPLIDADLKGIPQKTLAVQYNMSESGLKSRVQRGRIQLKALFTECCGHLLEIEERCKDQSC